MLKVIVLGSAAGGGLPQWNCNCQNCARARDARDRNGQVCLAVSGDDGQSWFLINASPDLRQQINDTPALHPRQGLLRDTPIAGVIVTNAEIDAIAGLLSLREGAAFAIHAHPKVLAILQENAIFGALDAGRIPRIPIKPEDAFAPVCPDGSASGLVIEAFVVPGKPAWFLEGLQDGGDGDTLGLTIRAEGSQSKVCIVLACAEITPAVAARLEGAALVFFDGTLWSDDEMIRAGLSDKSGARMGHVSMSGVEGVIARLTDTRIGTRVFVHINNSNPVLDAASPERAAAVAAGWIIPQPGQVFTL